jgi:kynurenine 3-monooxygenase
MEESRFDKIGNSKENLLEFFRTNFKDVVRLVGEEKLAEQYFKNPRLPLISVKVIPSLLSFHHVIPEMIAFPRDTW